MLGGLGLLHIILLSPRIRRHLRRNTSMVRHRSLPSSSVRKAFSKESVARIEGLLWGSAQNTLYLLSGSAQETSFQAQHRGSPLRLGLDDLPPLGFGTRISYLARPPIKPCRRFAMGVLLIGMGVRQPYVDTYSFIQFSTYDGGHLCQSNSWEWEIEKIKIQKKLSAIGCHFPPKSIS